MPSVRKMKSQGHFDEKELVFGQELYKHITSEPALHDLIPVYFEILPRGSHVPEDHARAYVYGSQKTSTTTPFLDIFQTTQQPGLWETLGCNIVESFAGQTTSILDLIEEVNKSTIVQTEMKDQLHKKALELFRQPANVVRDKKGLIAKKAQQRLWSVLLSSEGTDLFNDLVRTYVAHFPQGGFAKVEGTQRFEDLLHLATLNGTWNHIGPTVVEGFAKDMEGALIFVQVCKERSLPRSIWLPFLDCALRRSDSPTSEYAPSPERSCFHDYTTPKPSTLLKTMWDTAMALGIPTESGEWHSDDASRLLLQYIAKAQIRIAKTAKPVQKSRSNKPLEVVHDLTAVVQLARFPPVWEALKSKTLEEIGSDLKAALLFIKRSREANLPETVWGSIVDICLKIDVPTQHAALNDEAYQALLWHVAADLPTPTLLQKLAESYMSLPTTETAKARSALAESYKADRSSRGEKRATLEALLHNWLEQITKTIAGMQQERADAKKGVFPHGTAPLDPSLDAFLRSTAKSTTVERQFSNLAAARKYAKDLFFRHSTANAVAEGSGSRAFVRVTKTSGHARELGILSQRLQAEHDSLRELLPRPNEDRPPQSKKPRLNPGNIIVID
ncbi:hypothetical protein QFC22_001848 [Naganishia vaughanmartiniae]|uniref:Uncharacterized protein n=1 Tax=Naganishia vaughanmartiniae TaxID=1424756 RepID=A0ACC2XEG2_9TREE|nr:hypothetical protein QFC22_001848 [Naganishia vaughanmartiniae]